MNFSKIICNFFFFHPQIYPNSILIEKCPRSIFPTLLFSNSRKNFSPLPPPALDVPLSKASTRIFHFHRRKTLFSLPKHAPLHQSFDHSSFRYHQPRGQDTSRWTKVHTLGIRFSASRADPVHRCRRGRGEVTPCYLSPSPRGLAEK